MSATPGSAPATPTLNDPQPGLALVKLVWSYTANAIPVDAWQYRQRERNAVWGDWAAMAGSDSNSRDHTVTGLENGKTYEFQIRAVSVADVVSDESDVKSARPADRPAKPTGLRAEAGDMHVTLFWTDPGNVDIRKYQYEKNGDGTWEEMSGSGDATVTYTVEGLTNGTAYTFRIRAVTVGGEGPESDASNAVTPDKAPRRPSGFRLEPGNAEIALNWDDQSGDEVEIQRWQYQEKVGDAAWPATWTDIPNSGKDTTEYTVDRLDNGTLYGYRIRAVAAGDKFGPASGDGFATPADEPAAAVLTATAGARRVMLSWTLDPADPSILRWQYQQRVREGEADWPDWTDMWNPVPGSGPATRSHTVRGLTGEVEHEFRVRAVGYGGEGAPSNAAAVTPEPGPSAEMERRVVKRSLAAVAQATLVAATDTIGLRFDAAPGARSLTLAGRQLGGGEGLPEAGSSMADDSARGLLRRRDGDLSTRGQTVDSEALLRRSAFTLSLAGENAGSNGRDWTLWGRGDWRRFGARTSDGRWEGKQWTGWLGADARLNERLTAGLAFSQGESESEYLLDEEFEGSVETVLSALWPYVQVTTGPGAALRVVLGAGQGEATHRAFDGDEEKADLSMLAGSMSGSIPMARRGGVSLSAIGGAGLSQVETDGSSATSSIGGMTARSWRLRGGVEGRHDGFPLPSSPDMLLQPRAALSLRQDGGDGVTGSGAELSAGARASAPDSRFSVDASGHWLALHSADGVSDWGVSLEARLEPEADGRGQSLSLGTSWGQQRSGTLASEGVFDENRGDGEPQRLSMTARVGYGFSTAGGLLTPFAELSVAEDVETRSAAGLSYAVPGGLDARLAAENRDDNARVGLRMSVAW